MKKHTVKIVVELYYDIENMPDYSTSEGVAKMIEMAINDKGSPKSLNHFDDVLSLKPVEICINEIEPA